MSDVLNSFYSDIAAIETSQPVPVEEPKLESSENPEEPTKKKKKTKVI